MKQDSKYLKNMNKRSSADDLFTSLDNFIESDENLQFENEKLKKVKQVIVKGGKGKHSGVYKDLLSKLRTKWDEKDKQLNEKSKQLTEKDKLLAEKDKKLAQKERLIELFKAKLLEDKKLQAESDKKDSKLANNARLIESFKSKISVKESQLQSMSDQVNKFQAESSNKNAKLADNAILIDDLKARCDKKDIELAECARANKDLQAELSSKDEQLVDMTHTIEQLQAERSGKDAQTEAILDQSKSLKNFIHDNGKQYDVLCKFEKECCDQNQHAKTLARFDNAIKLEKSTQNRLSELANLFSNKAQYYLKLEEYQNAIDAATEALKYDFGFKRALFDRASAYYFLGKQPMACQDLGKLFKLEPTHEEAKKLLEKIQKPYYTGF